MDRRPSPERIEAYRAASGRLLLCARSSDGLSRCSPAGNREATAAERRACFVPSRCPHRLLRSLHWVDRRLRATLTYFGLIEGDHGTDDDRPRTPRDVVAALIGVVVGGAVFGC